MTKLTPVFSEVPTCSPAVLRRFFASVQLLFRAYGRYKSSAIEWPFVYFVQPLVFASPSSVEVLLSTHGHECAFTRAVWTPSVSDVIAAECARARALGTIFQYSPLVLSGSSMVNCKNLHGDYSWMPSAPCIIASIYAYLALLPTEHLLASGSTYAKRPFPPPPQKKKKDAHIGPFPGSHKKGCPWKNWKGGGGGPISNLLCYRTKCLSEIHKS